MEQERLNWDRIRARLRDQYGKSYWRSLEELAETDEFQQYLRDEFPRHTAPWLHPINRRDFLRLLGASLALAGLGGCVGKAPQEEIIPYVEQPEAVIPGRPLYFATAMPLGGFGLGLLVESHEGRPTKVEGNPAHPASLGATHCFAQAAVLALYDPDRSKDVITGDRAGRWEGFLAAVEAVRSQLSANAGAGLRVLTGTVTSPTLANQLQRLLDAYPQARWHQWEPVGREGILEGARLAFGKPLGVMYSLDQASVVFALDADFLSAIPAGVRHAHDFAQRRRVRADTSEMNRLYAVESTPTITGAMADHKRVVRPGQVEAVARALGAELGLEIEPVGDALPANVDPPWIAAVARDLQANQGSSLVIAGDHQPPAVHALAHAMNDALGNTGSTVFYTDPPEANPVNQLASLRELVDDMETGAIQALVILGGNPAFTAPADFEFGRRLGQVPFSVHLSPYRDETSMLCDWHIPAAHFLESWGDVRAFDGTTSIIQPLIAPLYDGKTAHEVLAALQGAPQRTAYEIVRDFWQGQFEGGDFESFWRTALHDGVVPRTALEPRTIPLRADWAAAVAEAAARPGADAGLDIIFRPDPHIWDGEFANNAWLQELPKPLTKLTWDNAALMSPALAERLGLDNGDVVVLAHQGREVAAPAWVMPGHAADSVTVYLGYGRKRAGRVAEGTGFDAYTLRTSEAPWFGSGLEVRKTGGLYPLADTQHHWTMADREVVRAGAFTSFVENPSFLHSEEGEDEPPPSLDPEWAYDSYAWGMAIDLTVCTGCNACVIACQAENNIPVVGKDQVMAGREMHWIRVDRYYQGDLDEPRTYFQPLPCMHCEKAPCEPVCPVGATVHSSEGLNDMVYNRCVGTRYCSNNCPYKVRRFNFLDYTQFDTDVIKLALNPDVTVRSRGVMEKCTYCVQRINAARIHAKNQDRPIRDGEVTPACAQACPTQAIVFGDINDPDAQVAQLKLQPHNYDLLADQGTRPRTSYLAKLINLNGEIEPE